MRPLLFALVLAAGCNSILGIGDLNTPPADATPMVPVIVSLTGTGGGTVRSTPPGIVCPPTATCSASFPLGTQVTLTATSHGGSHFGGWQTGGCTGTGPCVLTIGAGTSVDAQFDDLSGGHNFVFVTSETYLPTTFAPLTAADADCNASAAAAGLPGTYVAWLSTVATSARSRLGTARGWVRPDGQPFADTIGDITNGKIYFPANVTPRGVTGATTQYTPVATGTLTSGMADPNNCNDWTDPSAMYKMGDANGTGRDWTSFGQASFANPCTEEVPLYCFGTDHSAPLTITPISGRLVFLASGFTLGTGIADADAYCQTQASDAGRSGTFKALLATKAASAASRFDPSGMPWVRPDGIPIAPAGASPFDGLQTPINVTLAGTYDLNMGFASLGAIAPTAIVTASADDCNDWSDSTTTQIGESTDQIDFWFPPDDNFKIPCTGLKLYCFQQ